MPWQAVAFALGVFGVQQLPVLPPSTFWVFVAAFGLVFWLARRRWPVLAIVGATFLGLSWAAGHAHWQLADALPPAWEGRDIEVSGTIVQLPRRFDRSVRFVLEVEESTAPVPRRILLSWFRSLPAQADTENDAEAGPAYLPVPRAGERWRFVVRLKRPHGNLNPHGFDYESWLFERGIRATGHVRRSAITERLDPQVFSPAAMIGSLREATRERMLRTLGEAPYAGVLVALAVGDQQSIPREQWQLFSATGITHLMSISGLHVTMIGAIIGGLAFFLWRGHARLPLWWPAQKAAAVAGFSGAFAYALIAGFGVPAQRTLYMLAVVALALVSGRSVASGRVLGAALVLVLVIDPLAVRSPGFWLSFGAVALIFLVADGRLALRHWLIEWGRVQWAITLGLLPLLLALFQQFSLVSPIANALAIPLVSLVVTPLALVGALPGFTWVLHVAHALLLILMFFLEWLASFPGAVWQQHAPPGWAVPLALVGAVWLLMPRGFPARWAGVCLFLPLFLFPPSRPEPGEWMLRVLDVGQGLAVHVQTARHDLMFDTGPAFGSGASAGERILVPYLRAVGVRRLDTLIVSHTDTDHAGGAAALLAAVPVIQDERRCVDGQAWEWDGVRFRVLHPAAGDYARQWPDNALSCVLKIESAYGSALIPADITGSAEQALIERHGDALAADILVAPHHGSRRSASPEFVAAVGAIEVIFSVGYRNRFGHPHPDTLARFADARIHRTDAQGAITIKVGAGKTGGEIGLTGEREIRRRYWHNRGIR